MVALKLANVSNVGIVFNGGNLKLERNQSWFFNRSNVEFFCGDIQLPPSIHFHFAKHRITLTRTHTHSRTHTFTRTQKEIQINVAAAFNYDSLFLSSFFVTPWLWPRAAINPSAIICNQILDSKNSDPPMLQRSPLPLLPPPMKFFDSHHNWSNFGGAQIKHESTNTSWEIFSPQIWLP